MCNDYHVNLPKTKKEVIPQGGPSRFAQLFDSQDSKNHVIARTVSILFSHDNDAQCPYIRETLDSRKSYYEIVYDARQLTATYSKKYTKREYVQLLDPWISLVIEVIHKTSPDVLLLNGFSLSNWIIMEAAYRSSIPAYIQHAGIWKKEIMMSGGKFSSSIKRIFASFEKDAVRKTRAQIFLNAFSRDVFLRLHHLVPNRVSQIRMPIIPLPVAENHPVAFKKIPQKSLVVGMVARWDAIKNHAAFNRLARYGTTHGLPIEFRCVTKAPESGVSQFFEKYRKVVSIVPPMNPRELTQFYKSCNILIVPSRFDVSPTVVIEALTCGIPVIVSENTGWVEVYKKFGLSSMVVNPWASGKRLAQVIEDLQSHYSMYEKRYKQMREYLLLQHKPGRVFAQYINLFTK